MEALTDNANGLYQSIGQTFTTPGGYELPRAEELYRKFAASQRATRNFESVYDDVSQRRGILKGRIADTTQQLQASTTDAETQKLAGVITGYNAELAAIDKEVDQALAESLVLDMQDRGSNHGARTALFRAKPPHGFVEVIGPDGIRLQRERL